MKIDQNGKINGKASIIDVSAVVIILVAIVGILLRFVMTPEQMKAEGKDGKNVELSYVIEIVGIRDYSVKALEKRGDIIDIKKKYVYGKITDVTAKPQEVEAFDMQGKLLYVEVPERYTAQVTIEADGIETENGFYVGDDIELSVGSGLSIATKYVNTSGEVISIKKLKELTPEEKKEKDQKKAQEKKEKDKKAKEERKIRMKKAQELEEAEKAEKAEKAKEKE